MDGRPSEYQQSGLSSPYPSFQEPQSEGSSADQASAAQYTPGQDVRPSTFSSSATPTSEYGIHPSSARSGSFPEYIQRPYQQAGGQSGTAGAMAQTQSPSMNMADGQANNHHNGNNIKSDPEVPIDPSIASQSPTYPHNSQYSPYGPPHDMQQYAHPGQPMYGRPDWPGQYPPGPHMAPAPYGHPPSTTAGGAPAMASAPRPPAGGHPLSTVYSFVPIPGAQQHKRPRRRYEEIERMYKCGWNGCEKAYGTLNHLNAHVTMQSHGTKRTPEEFKEIRKEWKAKKKEEENQRKADEERQRQADGRSATDSGSQPGSAAGYGDMRSQMMHNSTQLPPIGYAPASGQAPPQYSAPGGTIEGTAQYGSSTLYNNNSNFPPQSPYGQPNQM
ncbi:hypothetical protein EV356DRAFT_525192 [Viridothelium virens]|uniref:C2H2-type domain-containing protein n=1 Tax=Viridothelium virens TaxID=1048519 RepID=A0A6A6H386_VIRVR|nr:hypothetical protein EV356DRAFT_525192 [Viridothelium virens]